MRPDRALAARRLARLPYQITIPNVMPDSPEHVRLEEAMDWLYEKGPMNHHWFVDQIDGEQRKFWTGQFNHMRFTKTWIFAFHHQRDACLFKLMFA